MILVTGVSGPAALGYAGMAAVLGREPRRQVRHEANDRAGKLSRVWPEVPRLLGRAATSFGQFARDHAEALR